MHNLLLFVFETHKYITGYVHNISGVIRRKILKMVAFGKGSWYLQYIPFYNTLAINNNAS